jgi:N-methylhydantoinase A
MVYRIAVDTGGTFTDVVVAAADGSLTIGKAMTTPDRPFQGIASALDIAAGQLGLDRATLLANTSVFLYGTTRATNAIVEGRTARTALLVTQGFPDILVLKEGGKSNPHQLDVDYPEPYIPRHLTFEISERIGADGKVVAPFDEAAARAVTGRLADLEVDAVAVCFLWSVVNPAHERRMGALLAELLPDVAVTLSHNLNPILREYRRASSAAIDASLKPLMQAHLRGIDAELSAAGYAGELLIATSFGGVMHVADVMARPIYMVRSGPALAPAAGRAHSRAEGCSGDVIVCDSGGTTFDVSILRNGVPKFTRDTWLGGIWTGHNTGLASVDVRSIGAGGGSIAWVDDGGLLRVGPHSAGADPGPACYGLGGSEATVTDAALLLGYLDPARFLDGRMQLDAAAAAAAVGQLAARLGLSPADTAFAVLTIANEHMIGAIRDITVNEGLDPRDSVLVAGGGAAGLNILPIARELGCRQVLLPRAAGAFSACGAHYSDIVAEFTASASTLSGSFDAAAANGALDQVRAEAEMFAAGLRRRGIGRFRAEYRVEARYLFQVWDLEVMLPVERFTGPEDVAALVEAFHQTHERVYAVRDPEQQVECLNWKLRLVAEIAGDLVQSRAAAAAAPSPIDRKRAYFGPAGMLETPIYRGADLRAGAAVDGPALIVEPTTTLVLYPGMRATASDHGAYRLDPGSAATADDAGEAALMAVLANRFDAIVHEMSNTLLRAARSAVINMGRDFSCAICTADNRLLSSAEGLPVHIFGMHLQTAAMCALHPDLAEGDAFLHNDPYLGNSHPADHTILVPVFAEGAHMFTVCAKAHQADIGNSLPTTYHAAARDVYEEGALIFPCVRVQRDGRDIGDTIRMCRARIRVPEQWYGDYLAAVGAARIGERRLKELVARYGRDTLARFVEEWFDYAERRMMGAIRRLPAGRLRRDGRHDPMPPQLPDGIPLSVSVEIDPRAGCITVDLTDNLDCVDCGLNQSQATATNNACNGVFNCIEHDIPHNAGSLRRIDVRLRENCVAGIPRHPHSCSMATTNVAHWLVNLTQSAFAGLGDGYGLAEGGGAMSAAIAVVSGRDPRRGEARYVNQLILGVNGGPASARSDGWVMYGLPVVAGLMYRDSIELDELKHPMRVRSLRLVPDSGGAGRHRGAPGCEIVYGPTHDEMTVVVPCDMQQNPPRGVNGGHDGRAAETWKIHADGREERLPGFATVVLRRGEWIRGLDNGGGGYGDPRTRDPSRIRRDVLEGWISEESARAIYGFEPQSRT